MEKMTLEEVNNMDAETMRQILKNVIIEQKMQERAEAERKEAEEKDKEVTEKKLKDFFARKNNRAKFGNQY